MSTVTSGQTHAQLLGVLLEELTWPPADLAMHLAERRIEAGTAVKGNPKEEARYIEGLFEGLEGEDELPPSIIETLENEWEGCFGGMPAQHHEKNGQSGAESLQQQRSEALKAAIQKSGRKVLEISRQACPNESQYFSQKLYTAMSGKKLLNDSDCAAVERVLGIRAGTISIRPATADEMKGRAPRRKSITATQGVKTQVKEKPKVKRQTAKRQPSSTPSGDGNVIVTLNLDSNLVRKLIGGKHSFDVTVEKGKKGLILRFSVQMTGDELFAMME